MRRRRGRSAADDGDGRGREPKRYGARGGRSRRPRPFGARARRRRRRRARALIRRAGGHARAQAEAPRHRRGDGRAGLSARRRRKASGRRAPPARRRRHLPTGRWRGVAGAARARPAPSARARPRRRDGGARAVAPPMSLPSTERPEVQEADATERTAPLEQPRPAPLRRPPPSVLETFNYAFQGVIHVLRTHRNMRIHVLAAVVVLVAAIAIGVSRLELMMLLLSITFVLIAEMINSAIEGAIDVATTSFDPMAKLAKDIAAGAVLIASVNAIAVGYLVFSGQIANRSARALDRLRDAPAKLTLISLVVVIIIVIATKAVSGRGTPLRGGLPSGHAAIAFAGWMAATYVLGDSQHRFLVSTLTFIMALLVAQTRVESGVHSALEVAYGGVLGALITLAVFQLF